MPRAVAKSTKSAAKAAATWAGGKSVARSASKAATTQNERSGLLPSCYPEVLDALKDEIVAARLKAAVAVNAALIEMYWRIGMTISTRMAAQGWGAKVVDHLAKDLRSAFPGMKGLSARNLRYMRSFAEAYAKNQPLQQAAAKIPWTHNCVILDRIKDPDARLWYIEKTVEYGWSRAVLHHQIDTKLYEREGRAITNFERTLPAPQSDLAREIIRDPYHLEFLPIGADVRERELEDALVNHIRKFLLELGAGFAFVGSQHHIEVDGEDYWIDLLFYHYKLRCFIALELKTTQFKPEYAGKMNFYLAAIDDMMRHPDDNPSIGIILCRSKGGAAKVKYALDRISSPIGVSTHKLPGEFASELPSVERLEEELRMIEIKAQAQTSD